MTDVPVSQEAVEVAQADRNAAIRILEAGGQDWQAKEIRLGQGDHFPIVQAFARHRQQAERDVIARMEVVAWLYDGPYGRSVHEERAACAPLLGGDWTETPLYALPTPPEAA